MRQIEFPIHDVNICKIVLHISFLLQKGNGKSAGGTQLNGDIRKRMTRNSSQTNYFMAKMVFDNWKF